MNKILLVISREYISRVKKKSFLIASILGPIFIAAIIIVPTYLAINSGDHKTYLILDESGYFPESFVSGDDVTYEYFPGNLEEGKSKLLREEYDGLVYIPKIDLSNPGGYTFYSGSNPSLSAVGGIEWVIDNRVEGLRLAESGLDREVIESFKVDTDIATINLSESGDEKRASSGAAFAIGYISSFLIYIFVFVYGAMCMRGVIEEKTSRIVEVIVSSIRPMQLMMGKIIGIAAVGLTQFLIWIVLSSVVITSISAAMGLNKTPVQGIPNTPQAEAVDPSFMETAFQSLEAINFQMVFVAFIFFFIGGYLLYGALFAAVGAASDSDADAQQFMFPVTIPLIFSIVMIGAVMNDPNSGLAFWLSMIPFTSPVIMMMRVAFGVEVWELLLSMVLLVCGFLFTTWLASRIYRVGILMHGTKVNWKVLAKWFMMSS